MPASSHEVASWNKANQLQVNNSKTDIIFLLFLNFSSVKESKGPNLSWQKVDAHNTIL
jgi:hypothetical protein